jgi:hypothetical protein
MSTKLQRFQFVGLIMLALSSHESRAQTSASNEFGFNRIIPGWTNYSTAFSTTHDLNPEGEYATVASFHTPPVAVRPLEYSAIFIWFGSGGQRLNFGNFVFQVHVWSSLDEFIRNPRRGDVASLDFGGPTGGSTTSPDTFTRGGRPAYLLRFDLTGASLTLTQCHTHLIGVTARATSSQAGELYVPTAPFDGLSDVQAGNIVPFGWLYLLNAGGQTIYSGQLATALSVQALGEPPRIQIRRSALNVCLSWPSAAGCYRLESADDLFSPSAWSPVMEAPLVEAELTQLCIPAPAARRWYRLTNERDHSMDNLAEGR